ncbi:MAG: hypothetical protein NTW73_01270, partial [Candidatus Parcubacteria bacterium]|nr:hypothetical protein [Candidatus Parcubacteria bacterium]
GNADNTAMDEVSGQTGAGKIWFEAMNYLLNTSYNQKNKFDFNFLIPFYQDNQIDYGLKGDDYEKIRNMLLDKQLVTYPQDGDIFLSDKDSSLILKSLKEAQWFLNGNLIYTGSHGTYPMAKKGEHELIVKFIDGTEEKISFLIR